MARRRKVSIKLGEKRIIGSGESMRIVRSFFCGECDRLLKSSTTQKPHIVVARICDNIENHKTGKVYLWVLAGVEMVGSSNQFGRIS